MRFLSRHWLPLVVICVGLTFASFHFKNSILAEQSSAEGKTLDARLAKLQEQASAARSDDEWEKVFRAGDELIAFYPRESAVLTAVGRLRSRYAAMVYKTLDVKNAGKSYAAIRQQLDWLDYHFLSPPPPDTQQRVEDVIILDGKPLDAEGVRLLLQRKAQEKLVEARLAKNPDQALSQLDEGMEIWPRLPGLRDELLKRQGKYLILHVGVRGLPRQLSPARAVHDSEFQALELIFESLLRTKPNSDGNLTYVPQLATALPTLSNQDRLFTLRKPAFWSDGSRLTASDLLRTFEMLSSPKLPGRNGELSNQIGLLCIGDDPFRLQCRLSGRMLDPLSPFTFKVLPREYVGSQLASADDEAFAHKPVGTGAYMLAGDVAEEGRTYVRFVVNPHHFSRGDAAGPRIREIRFFVYTDPIEEFARGASTNLVLLDVPTLSVMKLKAARVAEVRSMPTRRVWFLAVNCRNAPLSDQDLRRALAHGIDRRQILAQSFGGGRQVFRSSCVAAWSTGTAALAAAIRGQGSVPHDALNGPYPAGTWACCTDPRVPANLFDSIAAEAFLQRAEPGGVIELELKFPDGDPNVEKACTLIASQLAALGERAGRPIKVRPVRVSAHQLQKDLNAREFQLAYWRHDFPNDAYSLWPLIDPRKEAIDTGSNYFGFADDGTMAELLYKSAASNDFPEVRRTAHDLHVALIERMPMIPLWQLDYHIAVSPHLQLPRLDPLRVLCRYRGMEARREVRVARLKRRVRRGRRVKTR